jgi:hypothetical protein
MTPRVKHQIGLTMLHLYRGIILCMLSFCTFFLHELYLEIRKNIEDVQMLKQDNAEHKQRHLTYDADLIELKSRVNYLFENFNSRNKNPNDTIRF